MTFKVNDLALCVDARGLELCPHPTPRAGQVYVVAAVDTCCITRVGLVEVPITYELTWHCLACGAAVRGRANFYARRFVKVGELGAARGRAQAAVPYLTKEVI